MKKFLLAIVPFLFISCSTAPRLDVFEISEAYNANKIPKCIDVHEAYVFKMEKLGMHNTSFEYSTFLTKTAYSDTTATFEVHFVSINLVLKKGHAMHGFKQEGLCYNPPVGLFYILTK